MIQIMGGCGFPTKNITTPVTGMVISVNQNTIEVELSVKLRYFIKINVYEAATTAPKAIKAPKVSQRLER